MKNNAFIIFVSAVDCQHGVRAPCAETAVRITVEALLEVEVLKEVEVDLLWSIAEVFQGRTAKFRRTVSIVCFRGNRVSDDNF